MHNEPSELDRKKLLKLGILTQEMALLEDQFKKWRIMQRTLVIDLVQREVVSQSRASRIAEVGRDTIRSWVNVHPADFVSAQEEADLIVAADKSLDIGEPPELHPDWGKPSELPPGHGA
jgi:hypothetical protein